MQDHRDSFVVVDVETANHNLASICQIGIACFAGGALRDSWESLVNPEDYFELMNIRIHGIEEYRVESAPTWPDVWPEANRLLEGSIIVSHTPFDRSALHRACEKYGLKASDYEWLDSANVARRTWPAFEKSGYRLTNLARHFGITYQEHDALGDARCAGEILLRAIAKTGLSVRQWLDGADVPVAGPITHNGSPEGIPHDATVTDARHSVRARRDGNPKGPLHGEVLVFTGVLSMPRDQATDAACAAGCEVDCGVTKRTTLLVVGDQDIRTKLAGHEKSEKHRKAEELIAEGHRIRIIGESDFKHLCGIGSA